MHNCGDKYLNFEEEHVHLFETLSNFKEILLDAAFKVINQKAASIPVTISPIEHFELNVCDGACLDCGVEFIMRHLTLFRHVLNFGQVLYINLFANKKRTDPRTPILFVLNLGQLDIILETYRIFLFLQF